VQQGSDGLLQQGQDTGQGQAALGKEKKSAKDDNITQRSTPQ
jgi:hypothetical protein